MFSPVPVGMPPFNFHPTLARGCMESSTAVSKRFSGIFSLKPGTNSWKHHRLERWVQHLAKSLGLSQNRVPKTSSWEQGFGTGMICVHASSSRTWNPNMSSELDDGWPESEKDVFQAALRMVVVKDSR